MGILVSNGAAITFPAFATQQVITAVRARRASDDANPLVKALASSVTVAANEQFNFAEGALDFKHDSGDYTDDYVEALVEGYWGTGGSTNMEIDLMVGSSPYSVCSDTNYAQQSTNDWDIAAEAD